MVLNYKQLNDNEPKKIYHFNGKKYSAVNEIVEHSCAGCAFIGRFDCDKSPEKMLECKNGKIFMREL